MLLICIEFNSDLVFLIALTVSSNQKNHHKILFFFYDTSEIYKVDH